MIGANAKSKLGAGHGKGSSVDEVGAWGMVERQGGTILNREEIK